MNSPSKFYIQMLALRACMRVIKRDGYSQMTGFPEARAFEREFAAFLGIESERVVGVGSSTDALIYALKLAEIGPGDEVIVPAFGFISPAATVAWVGATPRFVDIERETLAMGLSAVENAATERTKAIIASHAFGHTGDLLALRKFADERGLVLIEDTAQLIGETPNRNMAGTVGHYGCFSFSAIKTLSSFGNGGVLVTPDGEQGERAHWINNYGARSHFNEYPIVGTNAPLQEIQAAILREMLPFLPAWLSHVRELAEFYRHRLSSSDLLRKHITVLPEIPQPYNVFPVFVANKFKVWAHLEKKLPEIFPRVANSHLPAPFQEAYRKYVRPDDDFSKSARVSQQLLELPLRRTMTLGEADKICRVLEEFVENIPEGN